MIVYNVRRRPSRGIASRNDVDGLEPAGSGGPAAPGNIVDRAPTRARERKRERVGIHRALESDACAGCGSSTGVPFDLPPYHPLGSLSLSCAMQTVSLALYMVFARYGGYWPVLCVYIFGQIFGSILGISSYRFRILWGVQSVVVLY